MGKKKHKASILQQKGRVCYLCARLDHNYREHPVIHEHHAFGGPNRAVSEAEGLKVYLCPGHHVTGRQAVHNNIANMRIIQQDAQRAYERTHTRQQFMELTGRNYLDE